MAVDDGVIVEIGPAAALNARYTPRTRLDATGKVLCPGFVDCHTHLVFGGERVAEFERKLAGATYQELLAAGGGILSTMRATRAAPLDSLVRTGQRRLAALLKLGTTTVEIKSGYGLDAANELAALPGVRVQGLMTMAPWDAPPDEIRTVFQRTRALGEWLAVEMALSQPPAFSMGMTDDFEIAIEEGATHVRVGRALFGEREATNETTRG